jgi:4'-phosphopantetheinyl transferase EntD
VDNSSVAPFDDVVARLFPPFVQGVIASTRTGCESPHPEERAAVASVVERRRREFLCGRACAHAALRAIGLDRGPIPVGRGRQPEWPPGVVGSISHAGDWAGAVVARAADAWGIGFDIEVLNPPLAPDVERLVLTPAERGVAPVDHPLATYRSKIAYSAKEAVYKCVFPPTGRRLSFEDVEVDVDVGASCARAWVTGLPVLDVGVVVAHGYVFTGVCVTA